MIIMAKRWHINNNNVALECRARLRGCPYGEEMHYDSEEEASCVIHGLPTDKFRTMEPREAYQETMKEQFGLIQKLAHCKIITKICFVFFFVKIY